MGFKTGPALVLLVLNWCCWVVLLGGVAASQAECEDNNVAKCGVILSLDWWTVWFQFFVLVLASLLLCMAAPLQRPTEYLVVMVTGLMMVRAYPAYEAIEGLGGLKLTKDMKHATQAYLGGLCLSMIFNILWLFVASLGTEEEEEVHAAAPAQVPMPATSFPTANPMAAPYAPKPMYVQQTPTVRAAGI